MSGKHSDPSNYSHGRPSRGGITRSRFYPPPPLLFCGLLLLWQTRGWMASTRHPFPHVHVLGPTTPFWCPPPALVVAKPVEDDRTPTMLKKKGKQADGHGRIQAARCSGRGSWRSPTPKKKAKESRTTTYTNRRRYCRGAVATARSRLHLCGCVL